MSRSHPPLSDSSPFQGFKFFSSISSLLQQIPSSRGTRKDAFSYRSFLVLYLFYFFNPIVTSLRSLQQSTDLKIVQKKLGIKRVSLGSLSEASHIFDPSLLVNLLKELIRKNSYSLLPREAKALSQLIVADGTLLPALPRMVWALWQNATKRASKMYLQFEVARGIPVDVSITAGQESEIDKLRQALQPGKFYVLDRGYVSFRLIEDMMEIGCHFLMRVKKRTSYSVAEERKLSKASTRYGVKRDIEISSLGNGHRAGKINKIEKRLRIIEVESNQEGKEGWSLITNQLEMDADLLVIAYKWRWQVELFFRWLKCIIGGRHWLAESENGVKLQTYIALLSCLMISCWTKKKANKRTYEMIQFYLIGWASEQEVLAHLEKLPSTLSLPAP